MHKDNCTSYQTFQGLSYQVAAHCFINTDLDGGTVKQCLVSLQNIGIMFPVLTDNSVTEALNSLPVLCCRP